MMLILLISTLAVVHCRPENVQSSSDTPSVEIEKQNLTQLPPKPLVEKSVVENTKEILQKIAQVNKQQGLSSNGLKANLELTSLQSRSKVHSSAETLPEFALPSNPFSNPIFDYLQRNQLKIDEGHVNHHKINGNGADVVPPGQVIRRKVTHQQVYLAPQHPSYNQFVPPPRHEQVHNSTKLNDLETQTIDNIKNIVANSHLPWQYQNWPQNPYVDNRNPYPYQQQAPVFPQLYNPYVPEYPRPSTFSRQQISWPWQQYFPIIIRDPLVQMWGAVTSMVEYGPEAQFCTPGANSLDDAAGKTAKKLNYNINNEGDKPEITIFGVENPNAPTEPEAKTEMLEIEDLKITQNDPVQFTLNFKSPTYITKGRNRNGKAIKEETKKVTIRNNGQDISPPIREQQLHADELTSETDGVVVDQTISKQDGILHTNNKKVFSKDNTGSGIFIHKIKVKAGGVAIAGPGGIATAGSGGTAIVGPNGYAYTHPDSLAIAGTGSKVIAIDPDVSLEDVVNGERNKTRKDGSTPREGKVVAVGPVVYYNKGSLPLPFGSLPKLPSIEFTESSSITLHGHTAYSNRHPNPLNLTIDTSSPVPSPNLEHNLVVVNETSPPVITTFVQELRVSDFLNPKSSPQIQPPVPENTTTRLTIPYKSHPLFHYLKTGRILNEAEIIRFRSLGADVEDTVTLVLKPVAKSVAGVEGKAIATPVSRAVLRKGTNVDILFEPEAVAVAGPGGIAHAQSVLEITYEDVMR